MFKDLPDIGDRQPRPFQYAGEVTRQPRKINYDEVDTEAPLFTRSKIGGARNMTTKPSRVDYALETDAGAMSGWTIETIGAEHVALTDLLSPSNGLPAHLLGTQPGWRRHWGRLTEHQVSEWTDHAVTFVSHFCQKCFDTGVPCVRHDQSRYSVWNGSTFACKGCRDTSSSCNWLIAYQSHPLEDANIELITDYRAKFLALQNRATIGTTFQIFESAIIVPKELLMPTQLRPRTTRTHTPPSPTLTVNHDLSRSTLIYDRGRDRNEPVYHDCEPKYLGHHVLRTLQPQAKQESANFRRDKKIEHDIPCEPKDDVEDSKKELAVVKHCHDPRSSQAHDSGNGPNNPQQQQQLPSARRKLKFFSNLLRAPQKKHTTPTRRTSINTTRRNECDLQVKVKSEREHLSQENNLPTLRVPQDESIHNAKIKHELVLALLRRLLPPPQFLLSEFVQVRHKRLIMTGVVINRKLARTWMYQVACHIFEDDSIRYEDVGCMWLPEFYLLKLFYPENT